MSTITKLHIKTFGAIKDKTIDLKSGINLFYGANESGKSTVCAFIEAMLYGMNKPKKNELRTDIRKKYLPWDTSRASGSMEFVKDDVKYIIERSFAKTKAGDKATIRYLDNWEECLSISPDDLGQFLFGLNEESFVRTIFVGQLSTKIWGKDDDILKILSNLSSTGTEDASFSQIYKTLEDAKFSVKPKQTAKSIMRDLEEKKSALEKEKEDVLSANIRLKDAIYENNLIDADISNLKKEIDDLIAEKEKSRKYEKFLADKKISDNILRLSKRKEDEEAELLKKQERLNSISCDCCDLDEELITDAVNDAEKIRSKIDKIEKNNAGLADKKLLLDEFIMKKQDYDKKAKKTPLIFISVLFAVSLALSVVYLPFAIFSIVFLLLFAFSAFSINKSKKLSGEATLKIKEIEENILKAENNDELLRFKNEEAQIYKAHGVSCFAQLQALKTKAFETNSALQIIKKEINMLAESIKKTENDISQSKEMLSSLDDAEFARPFDVVEKDLQDKNDTFLNLSNRKKELEYKIENETKGLKTIDVLESELMTISDEIAHYNSVYDSLSIAISVLLECEEEIKSGFTPELLSYICDTLKTLSNEKYSEIKLSDTYEARVLEPKANIIVDAENLSGGTLDLIYIAVRVGLLKALFQNNVPLLILDDTFLQLDDERQKSAISFLFKEKIGQSIYFTCHSDIKNTFSKNGSFNKISL